MRNRNGPLAAYSLECLGHSENISTHLNGMKHYSHAHAPSHRAPQARLAPGPLRPLVIDWKPSLSETSCKLLEPAILRILTIQNYDTCSDSTEGTIQCEEGITLLSGEASLNKLLLSDWNASHGIEGSCVNSQALLLCCCPVAIQPLYRGSPIMGLPHRHTAFCVQRGCPAVGCQ